MTIDDDIYESDWEDESSEFFTECPACGELNSAMGRLGDKWHFCCRMCGFWSFAIVKEKS